MVREVQLSRQSAIVFLPYAPGATSARILDADGDVVASLDTSTGSQVGPIAVVTADANGTLGVSSSAGLSNLASFTDVQANSVAIAGNSAAIMDLQGQTGLLFDLAAENSVQARRAASVGLRVSDSTVFTGGLGVGFDSGEVGARAGFQASW